MARNAKGLGVQLPVLIADGTRPPIRPGSADRVLVDAPCSGLGSLRRRPDARWRIDAEAPERLASLQTDLVVAGLELLKPAGVLTYTVCTLTSAESIDVVEAVVDRTGAIVLPPPEGPWQRRDGGAMLLPFETDGMMLFQLSRGAG